jgi:hypothetical protein
VKTAAGFYLQRRPEILVFNVRRVIISLLAATLAVAAAAGADGAGIVAAEVGCGYLGGVGVGIAAIPVGNIWSSEKFAGGGLYGFLLAYPAGVGLGVYGAGELWGDDSRNDWASAGAAIGTSYVSSLVGLWADGWRGLIIGMLLAPAVSTVTYNLVKESDEGDENRDEIFVTFSASF